MAEGRDGLAEAVPHDMLAVCYHGPATGLRVERRSRPEPGAGEVLLRVNACGVCRTDLHLVDGDLPDPKLPVIPGHEIVGTVAACGEGVAQFAEGERVGVPWLGRTCGRCRYCRLGAENLCDAAGFTGYTLDGGYAEYAVADARYCFRLPERYDDQHAAPLLCAGLIGYRAYAMAGDAHRVGIYGFGAAAHIIAQVARHEGREIYAFTRPGDDAAQQFARSLGAVWAGASIDVPPQPLDAALLFAPVGALVPEALRAVDKGGTVICAGIHMSDIPQFPYQLLWHERTVRSVANLTRADGDAFMALASRYPVQTLTVSYPLADAERAISDLRDGKLQGAAVLIPGAPSAR